MKQTSDLSKWKPTELDDLLFEAAQLVMRFEGVIEVAREEAAAEAPVIKKLEELVERLRHLRDGIHDAGLDKNDKMAKPRLDRSTAKAA